MTLPCRSTGEPGLRGEAFAHDPVEEGIVAVSAAMLRAVDLARRFAPLDLPILLVGPTGTGKEVLAQAIHRWSGTRRTMVTLDCGAVPQGLVPDALFGHRRGAFTTAVESAPGLMEQADGGTLFLDELASMPVEGQVALLRALETGEVRRVGDAAVRQVSVRLIGAVNGNVATLMDSGRLRADLYHRLAGGLIQLPPLRDRPDDLWPLAVQFAQAKRRAIAPAARVVLERYSWPGNARELRYVIQRAASLQAEHPLSAMALAEAIDLGRSDTGVGLSQERRGLNGGGVKEPERAGAKARRRVELLEACLAADGNRNRAAAILGISMATLYRRLKSERWTLGSLARGQPTCDSHFSHESFSPTVRMVRK